MKTVTLRGLLTRKVRSAMLAFAVVLGVAMIAGSLVLTDTIRSAFDGIYETATEGSDAVVSGRSVVDGSLNNADATLPASLLGRVRAVDGVATAAPAIADDYGAQLTRRDGTIVDTRGAPAMALGFAPADAGFSPLRIAAGSWASGPGEVVVDVRTAERLGYGIGDSVTVIGARRTATFRIVGTATVGGEERIGGATVAAFDLATAQALVGKDGRLDQIAVTAKPGIDEAALAARIAPVLPATAQVRTREAEKAAELAGVDEDLRIVRTVLLAFAGVALLVGAFVIVNTLGITVAQRTRELATLRLVGASARQVRRSVVGEGLVIGVVGSLVGLAAGIGLARALNALFAASGMDMPQADLVVADRTVAWSLAVGILVTVAASIVPAVRATRIAPTAAVREGAPTDRARRRALPAAGAVLAAVGAGAIVAGTTADGGTISSRLGMLAIGLVVAFVGVGLLLPLVVGTVARVVGAPGARLFGEAARLGRDNAVRNPGRTAATAAALMVGLALIACLASLGEGLRDSERSALAGQVTATHVISSQNGFQTISPEVARVAATTPGATTVSGVRAERALSDGDEVTVNGVAPQTITRVVTLDWAAGDDGTLSGLADGQAVVSERFAEDRALGVGEATTVTTPSGARVTATVAGIFSPSRFDSVLGEVVLTQAAFDRAFPRPADAVVLVAMSGPAAEATAALTASLDGVTSATALTTGDWIDERAAEIDGLLNMLYVLLALSVAIALLGMVNTLALAVMERTRELAMLRAVGASRRQVRRMIRHESVVIALIGAATGLPLGVGLAVLATRAMSEYDVHVSVPVGTLVVVTIAATVGAIWAAAGPARRAGRVQIVSGLADS